MMIISGCCMSFRCMTVTNRVFMKKPLINGFRHFMCVLRKVLAKVQCFFRV